MSQVASLSQKLRAVYGRYSTYIDMIWKFLLAFAAFFWIRSALGFSAVFSNPFILIIMALLSMIFPLGAIPVFSGILIVGQAFGLGLDAGAIAAVLMVVIFILFLRFIPEDSIGMILLPLTMFFGFGPLVPMVMGLKRRAASIFAVVSGVITYYFMANLSREAAKLQATQLSEYSIRLKLLINGAFSPSMVISTLALAATMLMVYSVRKLGFDYCRIASVILGGVVYVGFVLLGNMVLGAGGSLLAALISAIGSVVAALIIEILIRPLDYTRSEKLEFEDDDYYYYVKAIPKASVNRREYSRMQREEDLEQPEQLERPNLEDVNFEKRLEDSLRNL